jgi:hypothetical protein
MRETRKDKAAELLRLVTEGPCFSPLCFQGSDAGRPPHEVSTEATRRWLDSWVKPLVEELVPELRKP